MKADFCWHACTHDCGNYLYPHGAGRAPRIFALYWWCLVKDDVRQPVLHPVYLIFRAVLCRTHAVPAREHWETDNNSTQTNRFKWAQWWDGQDYGSEKEVAAHWRLPLQIKMRAFNLQLSCTKVEPWNPLERIYRHSVMFLWWQAQW